MSSITKSFLSRGDRFAKLFTETELNLKKMFVADNLVKVLSFYSILSV